MTPWRMLKCHNQGKLYILSLTYENNSVLHSVHHPYIEKSCLPGPLDGPKTFGFII